MEIRANQGAAILLLASSGMEAHPSPPLCWLAARCRALWDSKSVPNRTDGWARPP